MALMEEVRHDASKREEEQALSILSPLKRVASSWPRPESTTAREACLCTRWRTESSSGGHLSRTYSREITLPRAVCGLIYSTRMTAIAPARRLRGMLGLEPSSYADWKERDGISSNFWRRLYEGRKVGIVLFAEMSSEVNLASAQPDYTVKTVKMRNSIQTWSSAS